MWATVTGAVPGPEREAVAEPGLASDLLVDLGTDLVVAMDGKTLKGARNVDEAGVMRQEAVVEAVEHGTRQAHGLARVVGGDENAAVKDMVDRIAARRGGSLAGVVTTASVRSKSFRSCCTAGISSLFAVAASCPITAPLEWSSAATRWGAVLDTVRAPRTVLPSNAMTRRALVVWLRVHMNAPSAWSRWSVSIIVMTLRIVDSAGPEAPVTPRLWRTSSGWWPTHSAIATNDFAPETTAVRPTARTVARSWRRPRR